MHVDQGHLGEAQAFARHHVAVGLRGDVGAEVEAGPRDVDVGVAQRREHPVPHGLEGAVVVHERHGHVATAPEPIAVARGRMPHEADRRTTLAEITDEGRDVAQRATVLLNADAFGLAALGDHEQEQVHELLRTLRIEAGDFEEVKNPA